MKLFVIACLLVACVLQCSAWSTGCVPASELQWNRLSTDKWFMAMRSGLGIYECEVWRFPGLSTIIEFDAVPRISERNSGKVFFTEENNRTGDITKTSAESGRPALAKELVENNFRACFITDYDHHIIVVQANEQDEIVAFSALVKTDSVTIEDLRTIDNGAAEVGFSFPAIPYTLTSCPEERFPRVVVSRDYP